MCFYCHLNLVLQLILCFFLVAFSFTMVVDNVSFLLVHLINTHLSSYFYTTQMNWQEKWTHLPVRKSENHHGFGRTQVTVFDSNNLPLCFWQETLKCSLLTCPCPAVLLHSLWDWTRWVLGGGKGTESGFTFVGCHLCVLGQRSSLSAKLPRVRDFSEPCLPFNWHLHLLLIYPGQMVCS